MSKKFAVFSLAVLSFSFLLLVRYEIPHAQTQALDPRYYNVGNITVTDLWVDPVNGNDANNGSARGSALRTLSAAWQRIPQGRVLTGNGFRVQLTQGNYPESALPNYLEARYGTAQFPIIFNSVDGRGKAVLQGDLNVFDCKYFYLTDLTIRPVPAGDTLHLEFCDHVLMRGLELDGGLWVNEGQSTPVSHETLKANQCSYLYLEDSDIHGADDNAVDYVAVQYGHAVGNKVHNCNDWAMYAKGGSAYLRIEANEFYDAGTGGFTAGQGTGFEFMTSPWLHYEAYDIKVINNVVHDTAGAGLGVNGGYNILLAHNTLYRVGQRSHVIEVVQGGRACDGNTARCQQNLTAGGWGATGEGGQFIPSRNVFIYNNIVFNPAGYQSQYQHFDIHNPATAPANSNVPNPARVDVNLQIRGNMIWNGPANHSLGIEDSGACQPSNPTCNSVQLRADNAINTVQPQLVNPAAGDFRPTSTSNVLAATNYALPTFAWSDAPTTPAVPAGALTNVVTYDRAGLTRSARITGAHLAAGQIGAFTVVSAASYSSAIVAAESIVAGFGSNLASATAIAATNPLPTTLAGVTVRVRDSANVERLAPLFFVSPTQFNFQLPAGTATGAARIEVANSSGVIAAGNATIARIAPGLFSAQASGSGLAAAVALRVRPGNVQSYESIVRFDQTLNRLVAVPLDLGAANEQVYLILYGTGFRHHNGLASVAAQLGGTTASVAYAGSAGGFVGLDQANVLIPRSLIGRGEIAIGFSVETQTANSLLLNIK